MRNCIFPGTELKTFNMFVLTCTRSPILLEMLQLFLHVTVSDRRNNLINTMSNIDNSCLDLKSVLETTKYSSKICVICRFAYSYCCYIRCYLS